MVTLDTSQADIVEEQQLMLTRRECLFSLCTEASGRLSDMQTLAIFDDYSTGYFVAAQMFFKLAEQYRSVIHNYECVDGRGCVIIDADLLASFMASCGHLEKVVGQECMPDGSRHCHLTMLTFVQLLQSQMLF